MSTVTVSQDGVTYTVTRFDTPRTGEYYLSNRVHISAGPTGFHYPILEPVTIDIHGTQHALEGATQSAAAVEPLAACPVCEKERGLYD